MQRIVWEPILFLLHYYYGKYSLATHGWIQHQFTGPSTILNNALTFHFLDKSDVPSGPSLLFQTLSLSHTPLVHTEPGRNHQVNEDET